MVRLEESLDGRLARWIKWSACDVGEAKEGLENKLWRRWSNGRVGESSFSNLSVTSPTSQLILQPFRRFTYVTAHSPTLPLLHLRHSSFSNPSFASPTSQALHLIHLASLPWKEPLWRASIPGIIGSIIYTGIRNENMITSQWIRCLYEHNISR